jgi:hypothetical protein
LFHQRCSILPRFLELRDLFRHLITLHLQCFELRNSVAPLIIEAPKITKQTNWVLSPSAKFFFYQRQVGPYKGKI